MLQPAAPPRHAALAAGHAHGLQRGLQEAGGGRQQRRQEVHGGQRAAAGGRSPYVHVFVFMVISLYLYVFMMRSSVAKDTTLVLRHVAFMK